jgi:hypothetical protein
MSPEQREEEWNIVNNAINNTKTEQVPDNRGMQKYVPFTKQTKFGTLVVMDKTPVSPITPQN